MLFLISLNIGCDQASKVWVRQNVKPGAQEQLLSDYVILTRTENTGAFLGLGDELSEGMRIVLLIGLPLAVILLLSYLAFSRLKQLSWEARLAASFIIGGGLGNLWDRAMYGSVTDFLFIDLGFAHTGIFNVADMSVMAGSILFLGAYALKRDLGL
jgi:signal peptidase II